MSNLTEFAEKELEMAGLFDADSDYDGALGPAVMELVKTFSKQGHSGFSAGLVRNLFNKVSNFEPLLALQGTDDEWTEVGSNVFQNKRCSRVFKENGQAYDIEGIVWKEPNGTCFTNSESKVSIVFPYTPKTEYRNELVNFE